MNPLIYRAQQVSRVCLALASLVLLSCGVAATSTRAGDSLFLEVPSDSSGLIFSNDLALDSTLNVFLYRNYYNGGGVAIGDVTGDGLEDIYLTSNLGPNKLFRNDGELRFTDITDEAGVAGTKAWSTGVAIADVNGDGLLDIYVCNSGDVEGDSKENELFINDGAGGFADKAAEYGLADSGFGTHATFFDYDHDGDLDCYLLNNSFRPIATLSLRNLRDERDERGGDKLFRNEGGRFVDVSKQAGIYGSVIGFGLGVSAADVNGDGWEDLYISNDFYERDYLYINNRMGGFQEELVDRMRTISNFSMGADISDLDNDGSPEIFVTDMLPGSQERLNRTTRFGTYDDYVLKINRGFHHQVMRNTLQYNRGDGTFAEIGQQLGVAATDWSWGALIADFDNDGRKDIFISNGVVRDVTDQDFISLFANDENVAAAKRGEAINFADYVARIPSTKLPNHLFAQTATMTFADSSEAWGLARPSHSNGSAYADLDHDGDLDLVVSNIDTLVSLYENTASQRGRGSATRLALRGDGKNPFSLGTEVHIYVGEQVLSYSHLPVRGFQSSMTYQPLIGLGASKQIDSLVAQDDYGRTIRLGPTLLGDETVLDFATQASATQTDRTPLMGEDNRAAVFDDRTAEVLAEPIYHLENFFVDFDADRLLYYMNSIDGPPFAHGQYHGQKDALLYFGGSAGYPGHLLVYDSTRARYLERAMRIIGEHAPYEDVAAVFADLNGDGRDELVIGSGGSEFRGRRGTVGIRVYEQAPTRDGSLEFVRSRRMALNYDFAVSALLVDDFDLDGDLDIACASRVSPVGYGLPGPVAVFVNTGGGVFELPEPTEESGRATGGMVSALAMADLDLDGRTELVAVGEFMPVTIYRSRGSLYDTKDTIAGSNGLYRSVSLVDVDGDRRPEIIVGGYGDNTLYTTHGEADRLSLYYGDFDDNGQPEHIFTRLINGSEYPLALKTELQAIMPSIKKKYLTHREYSNKTVEEVFGEEVLAKAYRQTALRSQSCIYHYNQTERHWGLQVLPWQAQVSLVTSILPLDADGDGDLDLLMAGNFYGTQPRVGPLDASRGTLLLNDGGDLRAAGSRYRLNLGGQVRHLDPIRTPAGVDLITVTRNSGPVQFLSLRERSPLLQ